MERLSQGMDEARKLTPGRLGIFGGTFDPPHIGHLALACEALHAFDLERVLWVLTPHPPHKRSEGILPLDERLALLERAIADTVEFEVCRVDIDRPPPHYAVDTLRLLREQYPQSELYYLIGEDSLRDLRNWHQPEVLLVSCDAIGVMRRSGSETRLPALEAVLPGITARIKWMDAPVLDISSSDIRRRVTQGRPYRYLLSEGVYQMIYRRRLYRI
jgi:nicotinate-nucleotide adenylyltransferase